MARFQKGQSGNPAGRPKGITDKRAKMRQMLEAAGPEIVSTAIGLAKCGDATLLVALLNRLVPTLKQEAPAAPVPVLNPQASAEANARGVLGLVAEGKLSGDDGAAILGMLKTQADLQAHGSVLEVVAKLLAESGKELPADLRLRLESSRSNHGTH
ncbi:DUF5681 domain-containing protein [Ralstonia pseudosolanacearum]|uniref:DUF5681 domain-containing protein n=1 Tax=Ralstonia pseudosolanacearum TaxID=1310165 RepID=UPI001FFB985B|nr:DUF5681 domain-containing protein [Ralstonia pseudosolanacearum]